MGPPRVAVSATDARISPHGSSSRTSSPGLCGPSSLGPSVTTQSVSRSLGTPGTRSAGATGAPSTIGRGRQRLAARGLRCARVGGPQPGQGGVEEPDEADGVGTRGRACVPTRVTEQGGVEREATEEHPAVGAHVQDGRAQREVVHAAATGDLQRGRGLADDGAGLVGGQRALRDEPREGLPDGCSDTT